MNVAFAADYDVLIRNGNVYDGTGAPPYVADIAISGDRVSAIGDFAGHSAEREIDASGLAVAPGFFNLLSHGDYSAPGECCADHSSRNRLFCTFYWRIGLTER